MILTLTQGKTCLIDESDLPYISQFKWHACKDLSERWCAARTVYVGVKKHPRIIRMHRDLLNAKTGDQVDHINGDGLDNRRSNLRICSHQQNAFNRKRGSNNKSGYKGVSFYAECQKWVARIKAFKKDHYIGHFDDPVSAAIAYDRAALEMHGPFARLNFADRRCSD